MEPDAPQEPPNPPSAAQRARQGSGRTPKLRASCDNCSNAKVRCDQDRPACQRCLYVNIQCNYSASRRMGKPPVSARKLNDKSKTTTTARRNSKADSYSADNTSECSNSPRATTQRLPDTRLNSYGQDFDYAASQPWNEANFMTDRSGAPGSFITDLLDDSLNFNNFSNSRVNASHLSQPQMATAQIQPDLSTPDQLNFSAPFPTTASPNSSCIRVGARQSAFQAPPDLLASSNTISDQRHSVTHQSASCVDLASSTLHSLSLPSSLCTSSPTAIPFHTIEQVLATSRSAISAFHTLLQCPCSHSSSFALTLALMISKILGCYSAICRCSTTSFSPTSSNMLATSSSSTTSGHGGSAGSSRAIPSSSSSSTSLANSSTPGSSTSVPRGPHNMVLDSPITIGTYKIDADDEHVLLLQLVFSELRKVGKLVDAFAGQYTAVNPAACSMGSGNDIIRGKSNSGEESMYKSLEQYLRYQVYQARREVSALLRESEEDV